MRYSKLKTVLYVYLHDMSMSQRKTFEEELTSRKIKFKLQLQESRYSIPIKHELVVKFLIYQLTGQLVNPS